MTRIPWRHKRQEAHPEESGTLADLRGEVDRLLDSWVREPLQWAGRSISAASGWSPKLNMAETGEAVTVWAEVPGVNPDRVDITVTGDMLVISGEKEDPVDAQGCEMRFSERRHGPFRRAVQLPSVVNADQVTAEYRHGVLVVRLPKVATAPPSKITVQPS